MGGTSHHTSLVNVCCVPEPVLGTLSIRSVGGWTCDCHQQWGRTVLRDQPFNSGIGCCLQVGSVRIKLLDSQLGAGQLGVQLLSEKTPQNSPHNKPIKYMTIFFFLNNARGNAPSYSQTRSLPQPLHTCHMAFFHKPLLQKTADGPPCRLVGWQHRGRACTFPAQQIVSSCATYRHPNSCN